MSIKFHFLSAFREFFIPHYRSLEFRAKIFTAILLAKKSVNEKDYDILLEIGEEIYSQDDRRSGVLVVMVKEYIEKSKNYKYYDIDAFLKEISKELKITKRYAKKIDFSHLRRLISTEDEEDALIQQRVYEFLVNEVKTYL